jgi:hypothetical protein
MSCVLSLACGQAQTSVNPQVPVELMPQSAADLIGEVDLAVQAVLETVRVPVGAAVPASVVLRPKLHSPVCQRDIARLTIHQTHMAISQNGSGRHRTCDDGG